MRLLAIIANLAQLSIVLLFYFNFRVQPGGWVIPALFGLLVVTLLNLVALLFYSANQAIHQPLFGHNREAVKRLDLRIAYATAPHPTVIVNDKPYNVLDLSERGVRFSADAGERLPKRIKGRITLLSGRSLSFSGTLARRLGDQASVRFAEPINKQVLLDENCLIQSVK